MRQAAALLARKNLKIILFLLSTQNYDISVSREGSNPQKS